MRFRASFAALALVLLPACNNTVVVELQTGVQTFELNAASLAVPDSLRDPGAPGAIASIDCSMAGICPSTTEVPVTCAGGICNPDPLTVAVQVGEVVDFQAILNMASPLIRIVDEIQIARADYSVSPNSLTLDLPSVEVLWAPEAAVSVDAATLLGTLPAIPAGAASSGEMTVDVAGAQALSTFVLGTTGRIRIFARASVDLEPGGPFPEGAATASVNLRLRAIGRIID